jgi:hypothetical protein
LEEDDLLVNEKLVAEPYAARGAVVSTSPIVLGQGQVLLLPDNRREKVEPSEFAPVPIKRLVGRATRVVYPFSKWRVLE